jgi:hypothetical protein
MDKEKGLEQEEADLTGFSEEKADKAVDMQPKNTANTGVTLFSSAKKITKKKKVVLFE